MADQAESGRRAPPMTPPPPQSPAIPEDNSSEAILWAASSSSSTSSPPTDWLSLWASTYKALPQPEAEEETLADVPTVLNFDFESSFPDLVDWNTTYTDDTQAPVVTPPLWMQLHDPATGEVDDLSRLTLGIQSPKASILPPALRIQDPEAIVSPLALGIQPPPASSKTATPQASLSPLALGLPSPPASFEIQHPPAPISPFALGTESCVLPLADGIQFPEPSISPPLSPLALGIQSSQISVGNQSAPSSFSSQPRIPCTLPAAPPLWNDLPSIPCTLPMAPPVWSLPSNPCTVPAPPPLWLFIPSTPSTLPVAPPLWNFPPRSCPVPERRSWSEIIPSTPPPAPAPQLLLLPHSASPNESSPASHPSHQPHHFFPVANTGYQQQVPAAVPHTAVTFPTPNAIANFCEGSAVPASRLSWSTQAMAASGSSTPNQPLINNDQDVQLRAIPIPRRPRFLLPPAAAAAATMPESSPPLQLANFGSSEAVRNVNMPNWNARGEAPGEDQQRIQTGESRRKRKRSKVALDSSSSEASHLSHDGTEVALLAREKFAPERALNTNGEARALPGTATASPNLLARYKREEIKQRIKMLQRLIPNGDEANMIILLEQTHIYIKFLEQQIKLLTSSVDWKLAMPFVYNNLSDRQ